MNKLYGSSLVLSKNPKKLIILLHGYGDYAENFISLAHLLKIGTKGINFYVPNAPFSLPQTSLGRQWFNPYPNNIHYDEVGLKEKNLMKNECKISTELLKKYIDILCLSNKLLYEDCFLIGFSQGAMIAYELGIFLKKKLAGCVMLSGRILSNYNENDNLFTKTPLLIIHGSDDDIVYPKHFTESCRIAKSNGFCLEKYLVDNERHNISEKMLQLVQNFLIKYM